MPFRRRFDRPREAPETPRQERARIAAVEKRDAAIYRRAGGMKAAPEYVITAQANLAQAEQTPGADTLQPLQDLERAKRRWKADILQGEAIKAGLLPDPKNPETFDPDDD